MIICNDANFPDVSFTDRGAQHLKAASALDPYATESLTISVLRVTNGGINAIAFLTILVLRLVGAEIDDEWILYRELKAAYTPLLALPNAYRPYPVLPSIVSFETLLAAVESKRPEGVNPFYRCDSLWSPNTEQNSYTAAELNGTETALSVRVALRRDSDATGRPLLLHFLDMPYDERYRENRQKTQLEALETYETAFEAINEGYNLQSITARDFLVMTLMDRIEGKHCPLSSYGRMRCPELGRRTIRGHSSVGLVDSFGGRLSLGESSGGACRDEGLGLSAGKTTVTYDFGL